MDAIDAHVKKGRGFWLWRDRRLVKLSVPEHQMELDMSSLSLGEYAIDFLINYEVFATPECRQELPRGSSDDCSSWCMEDLIEALREVVAEDGLCRMSEDSILALYMAMPGHRRDTP